MKKCNIILVGLLALLLTSCEHEPVMHEGHEVVDLGLPSGTLWATCNIGADTPEQPGAYFSWGETQEKDYYDSNYKFYDWDARFLLTKYSTDSINRWDGWVDNLTILEPQDDAATVHWGEHYRMPTREEFEELLEYCTWEWETLNYREGVRLTGKNGGSIFLPAAGIRFQDLYKNVGLEGCYWSSSLCLFHNIDAYTLEFDYTNKEVTSDANNRHMGYSVRAVYSPKKRQ